MLTHLKNFVFPSLCLHCREGTEGQVLCRSCLTLLDLLPHVAAEGKKKHPMELASTFERRGPAADLVRDFRNYGSHGLAKTMAAFMVVQWDHLQWPLPDLIVPVAQSLVHRLVRGHSTSLMLSEEMGVLLNKPVKQLLRRRIADFSQEGLSVEQRRLLNKGAFSWKKREDISGKTVLLIDDFHVTGTTLKRCTEVLHEGFPKKIYALTFCSSEH
jgi:competence protein ComFC